MWSVRSGMWEPLTDQAAAGGCVFISRSSGGPHDPLPLPHAGDAERSPFIHTAEARISEQTFRLSPGRLRPSVRPFVQRGSRGGEAGSDVLHLLVLPVIVHRLHPLDHYRRSRVLGPSAGTTRRSTSATNTSGGSEGPMDPGEKMLTLLAPQGTALIRQRHILQLTHNIKPCE